MRWFYLAPIDFLVGLLAFPLAPLIVLITSPAGISPHWCWPWLTHDNPIDGDAGHWARWPDNGMRWRRYCRRVAWLWRNRGYGFSYCVCGLDAVGPVRWRGNPAVSDTPLSAGWCWATCNGGWMFYAMWPWWRSRQRGTRVYLGWKLKQKIEQPNTAPRAMLVTHINPFKGYTGGRA
ncbi:hypothetical protein [Jeongeupia sp. USM3]|uniref:DUF7338 family protein n=1 Tax=Jeongeupia sp. USM3 TaxID=1906741 RepID=UPI00089DF21C|nr:hypothetical protein [Jeongeupia sp. USM3]AOY00090.1 hypothetical protein BJP62_06280 [Jeongeupia sp. USM3]